MKLLLIYCKADIKPRTNSSNLILFDITDRPCKLLSKQVYLQRGSSLHRQKCLCSVSRNTQLLAALVTSFSGQPICKKKCNYVMGNIFSRAASDQLRAIKPIFCAAQRDNLISFKPGRVKKKSRKACSVFLSLSLCRKL